MWEVQNSEPKWKIRLLNSYFYSLKLEILYSEKLILSSLFTLLGSLIDRHKGSVHSMAELNHKDLPKKKI